jgi:cytochrome c nitrite reductase small subunit
MRAHTLVAILIGVLAGLGAYTFRYAEGFSYFSTDPRACANCHIMRDQFDSWQKSSHHAVAKCIDCHLPHDLVGKYLAKASNGYWHSRGFTLQDFHEPIRIKPSNSRILLHNCMRCHANMAGDIAGDGHGGDADVVDCVRCHAGVGHGPPR